MPEYIVRFQPSADLSVRVEADDVEAAVEQAHDNTPSLCGHCAGWRAKHSLDVEFSDMEPYVVADADGEPIATYKTYVEQLQDQIAALRAEVKRLKSTSAASPKD